MLDRRALLMSAAIVGPALTAMKANAGSGACAPENVAANAALLDRYVTAVNAGDTAALQALFAKPYSQHGGLKGGREAFSDIHVTVEDRSFGGDKIGARNTWWGPTAGFFSASHRPASRLRSALSTSGASTATSSPSTGT